MFQTITTGNRLPRTGMISAESLIPVLEEIDRFVHDLQVGLADAVTQSRTGVAALTDKSGGTASDTIAAIADGATKNAVASLTKKVNALLILRTFIGRINI